MMKPRGKCFAKRCEECNWYREKPVFNKELQQRYIKQVCSFEYWFSAVNELLGSLDGLQKDVDQGRNASLRVGELFEEIIRHQQNGRLSKTEESSLPVRQDQNHSGT